MELLFRNNYLHYNNTLDVLGISDFKFLPARVLKSSFLHQLLENQVTSEFVFDVIRNYRSGRAKYLERDKFASDLERSRSFSQISRAIKIRGFSYLFFKNMISFPFLLREAINLRFAMMASPELYYPPKVRASLPKISKNHYRVKRMNSIAFALGSQIDNSWYIFTLQSDMVFEKQAALREHFRGWRRLLFHHIIEEAKRNSKKVYLSSASEVYRGCHTGYPKPERIPSIWHQIYDGTAEFFGMKQTVIGDKVNMQLFARHRPVYSDKFYQFE